MGITLTLGGCAASPQYRPSTYVVRPQDTLYSIAWRHGLDYRDLAKWNHIGSDYRLAVGQVLMLQPDGGAAAPRSQNTPGVGTPRPVPDASGGKGSQRGGPVGAAGGAAGVRAAAPSDGRAMVGATATKWLWPTEHSAPPRPVPGGGILLFGKLGQDVRAAGAGRVVYTGSGIRGYGNLIIVKHDDNLLSSYAHNSEMLVHEGQDVFVGEVIAHMGTAAHQTSALYFEIRLNGKPVDPLRYLPAAK
jgi:lipoprotein NlpD